MKTSSRLVCSVFPLLAAVLVLSAAEPARRPRVALVFDDGPTPEQNAQLLAILAKAEARVTFANVGQQVVANPALARAILAAGHEIINHSYTHPHFKELDDAEIAREVGMTSDVILETTGRAPRWFWSPFGDWDDRIGAAVRRGGLEHFPMQRFTYLDTRDWDAATTGEQFRARATTGLVDGTIIQCHEWPKVTLENIPAVLAALKRRNVEFVTFSELEGQKR